MPGVNCFGFFSNALLNFLSDSFFFFNFILEIGISGGTFYTAAKRTGFNGTKSCAFPITITFSGVPALLLVVFSFSTGVLFGPFGITVFKR